MRWLLALALVLHFTGLPAVGGAVCTAAAAGTHSCCETKTPAGDRIGSHCGCAMMPGTPREEREPVGVAAESREAAAAAPAHQPSVHLPVAAVDLLAFALDAPSPPARHGFLSGAGFRC